MARHPLTASLAGAFGELTRRLLAQALDAAFLVSADAEGAGLGHGVSGRRLAGSPERPATGAGDAMNDGPVTGIGWAMTARRQTELLHRLGIDLHDDAVIELLYIVRFALVYPVEQRIRRSAAQRRTVEVALRSGSGPGSCRRRLNVRHLE